MASDRRRGATSSQTRAHLLDVAGALMVEEGYAAVTSRRLGAAAGVSSQLVHYYFRTMDELFVELFRRGAEASLAVINAGLERDSSLPSIWRLTSNPLGATLNVEFAALAHHRKQVQAEIASYAEQFRQLQHDAVAARLDVLGIREEDVPPVVALLAMTGLAQIMALEASLGVTTGHEETRAYVARLLERIEAGERVLS